MTQKTIICLILAVFFFCALKAQETERSVLSSTGDNYQSGSLELSWTLGEIAVETYSTSSITACLGMQQGAVLDPISSIRNNELSGVSVFPNPVTSLTIVTLDTSQDMEYDLFDLFGRRIFNTRTSVPETILSIDMKLFPSGNYFLRITEVKTRKTTSLKVQKK